MSKLKLANAWLLHPLLISSLLLLECSSMAMAKGSKHLLLQAGSPAGAGGGGGSEEAASSTQTDVEALLRFKADIEQDPLGILTEWGGSGKDSDPCSWPGVSCSSERVVALDLSNAGLVAPLAISLLSSLSMLQRLDLSGNALSANLSGVVLPCAGRLQSLNLASNLLVGVLPPDFLACVGELQLLDLSRNNISGPLPPQLFSLCGRLQLLDLSHNSLFGSLPSRIGQCSSLQHLNLSRNLLSGELPTGLLSSTSCAGCKGGAGLQTIDLSVNNLSGTISDLIFGDCGSLVSIDLSTNKFSGELPSSIERCNALQMLNFSSNKLESHLPASLGRLPSVTKLYLSDNQFVGPIPHELSGLCPILLELDLSGNNLTGTIPSSFAACSSLQTLDLSENRLSGSFPSNVVSHLPSLENLMLAFNGFSGSVPVAVNNCTNLKVLDLSSNNFTGTFPPEICTPTFKLEKLLLPNNHLFGEVPAGLANCSQLKVLDLSFNLLIGAIPVDLSYLTGLESLSMWFNGLSGEIPKEFGRLTNVRTLILNNNLLSGVIPEDLSNCSRLEWLSLINNQLNGVIPPSIGNMQQLTLLELANNSLSGALPLEFGNCTNLLWLDLHSNMLSGTIPSRIGRHATGPPENRTLIGDTFAFVRNMDSSCRGMGTLLEFYGIPEAALRSTPMRRSCKSTMLYVGHSMNDDPDFSSIQFLDLSYNSFYGSIPEEMGYSRALQVLDLSHNQLTGHIPATFSYLRNVGLMDLSYNLIEGSIWPLANCTFLVEFDLSNNNLSGQIPQMGQLNTAPASSYANNPLLCGTPLPVCGSSMSGGDTSNQASACPYPCVSRDRLAVLSWANSIVLGILISLTCLCILIVWAIMMRARNKGNIAESSSLQFSCNSSSNWNFSGEREPLSINVATFERPLRKLTFSQLIEATKGFNEESLIGVGGFGEVYKAELKDGSVVAIKKLLQFSFQGDREFMAEMETLGKIKHRNLVPLLGYCKVGEERLLVYEYMHGGSLDDVLHGDNGRERLNWDLRKQIAKGAARGLAFLHHNCIPHIIHRDMKSSNVLLDKNFEARVSDFGMARLINALDTHLSVSTLAGTPGYVPPEYYQSFRCTAKGDVYSFGVILLELLTGKRPTEKEEFEDSNLVGWVKLHVHQKRSIEVLDPELRGQGADDEMLQYLKISCDCLEDHPSRRPTMLQVVAMFKELVLEES